MTDRYKQSIKSTREMAYEYDKANCDLTFAEWCYEQGVKDQKKFWKEFLMSIKDLNEEQIKQVLEKCKELLKEQNEHKDKNK